MKNVFNIVITVTALLAVIVWIGVFYELKNKGFFSENLVYELKEFFSENFMDEEETSETMGFLNLGNSKADAITKLLNIEYPKMGDELQLAYSKLDGFPYESRFEGNLDFLIFEQKTESIKKERNILEIYYSYNSNRIYKIKIDDISSEDVSDIYTLGEKMVPTQYFSYLGENYIYEESQNGRFSESTSTDNYYYYYYEFIGVPEDYGGSGYLPKWMNRYLLIEISNSELASEGRTLIRPYNLKLSFVGNDEIMYINNNNGIPLCKRNSRYGYCRE